jgi:exoribonuclease-2
VSYVLFEDAGKFAAGRVMSPGDASLQVELESGKRVKVKQALALLAFDAPAPSELLRQAQDLASQIDLDLAWEFAPDADFGFADLARDYFDAKAGPVQQAAALLALQEAPHYFRRLGKGNFRKAGADTVKAALAAIEKRKQIARQIQVWADELIAGRCAEPIAAQIYKILFKPDKNAPEYKAVVDASRRSQRPPLDLLRAAGAIGNAYQFHWRRFLFERFPQGTRHPVVDAPEITEDLPLAEVRAFSIDDSTTTEIDDALSLQGLGSGRVTLGIHIAAPGLAITPGSALDKLAQERLSTVYVPGWKLTMLPDAVVAAYTLDAGRPVPAVSLYVDLDETSLEILDRRTRLERVPIVENLRHDQLDEVVTEEALDAAWSGTDTAPFPFAREMAFLWRLAKQLKAARERVRGKPENFNRPDPVFRLEGRAVSDDDEGPTGNERIEIGLRRRGAPLDLIVAEAMILANSSWGSWLAELRVPAIYRSQASLAPGVKVRMGTKPAPHAGIGVDNYAWSTSPLRRYVDLVNQWQIIAAVRHGNTAALAAPFKPRDASLLAIVSSFDAAYADYATVQRVLERYWMLRWLQQRGVREIDGTMVQDATMRADAVPLVLRVTGTENLPRGARVRARVTGIDELSLDVHATLAARLQESASPAPGTAVAEEEADDDQIVDAAPLALAIDVTDATDRAEESTANGPTARQS